MKKNIIFLILSVLLFAACKENKKELAKVDKNKIEIDSNQVSEGYSLLKTKCYACHNPNTKSHEEVIAPPLAAVKKRYLMMYKDKESFTKAITNWTLDPKEEKAIMRGAVAQYRVMPYQNFNEEEIKKIATYIYENELEAPEWFEVHEKEIHGGNQRGMGIGRGMGRKN